MEESLAPPEGNIFDQFDVTGELLPGGASTVDGYFCRLPPCLEEKRLFKTRRALFTHRRRKHSLQFTETYKIPEEYQIRQWLLSGKPRPYEIPQGSSERTTGTPRSSLLSYLLHYKPDTESELQPASLESNIFEQFDVRHEPGEEGGAPYVGFVCLLSQCHEEKVCLNTYAKWITHRRNVHKETKKVQGVNLPDVYEIREWVALKKPRPYEVPVRGIARKKEKLCPVDPAAETSTEHHNREVNPTPSNVGNKVGNEELHKLLSPEGHSSLRSSKSLARLGKFRPSTSPDEIPRESRRRGRRPRNADAAGCSSDTEPAHQKKKKRHSIHSTNRSQSSDSTDSDSSDVVVLRVVAPSGGLRKQFMEMTNLIRDDSDEESDSETEDVDMESDYEPEDVDMESDDGTEDVDEESDDGSENVDDLSVDRTVEDPNHDHHSADMDEFGEEPREDSAWPEDALPSLPYSQPELHDSGEMAEVDEDAHEEFEAPDNVDPSQPELHNVKGVGHTSVQSRDFQGVTDEHHQNSTADITKAGEEASEEFEAPDDVFPPLPEWQNVKVMGHSSVQHQDFQGVTDEHQKNSNAEMVDADEEAPNDSVAPENVLPSLQNSTAEMGEVEEEEPEDFVAQENALSAFAYSQPKLWEHSSVQSQDFQGDGLETLPNPTADMDEVEEEVPQVSVAIENVLSSLSGLQSEFGVTGIVQHANVLPQEFPGETHALLPETQMVGFGHFGEADEEFINPWNSSPSVQFDVSEQIAISPLWHLDGETFQRLPQEFPGENWPNPSKEDNLKDSAEMAEFGEKAPEEIVAAGNSSLSVQSESSEQNALSTLEHYFRDALQFSPEDSRRETDNHRPNSNAEMAELGEEAPEGFVAPGNFGPWIPLMQSEGTKVPSLKGPIDIQAAPVQEFVNMDQVFVVGSNAAVMAEVGEAAPEGFVAPGNLAPWIPLTQSEGTQLPSLEGAIDIQAAFIQESVPRVHVDPVFINGASAAGMSEFGEEALEEFAAPTGNLMPLLPSNAPQETGKQLYVSSLNTVNASWQDPRNIQNEPIIHEYHPWTTEFINTYIDSTNEPAVVVPFASASTQPEGREIGNIFMVQGSAENSRENQVDPFNELPTLIYWGRAFEFEPGLPLIDDRVIENPEEFFRLQAVALQQLFNSGNSNNFPGVPDLQTDPDIEMDAGLEYELRMRLQSHKIPACLFNN